MAVLVPVPVPVLVPVLVPVALRIVHMEQQRPAGLRRGRSSAGTSAPLLRSISLSVGLLRAGLGSAASANPVESCQMFLRHCSLLHDCCS